MAQVELECAVYGDAATMFPVTVRRDASVHALQEAIAAIVSTDSHSIKPHSVELFLARREDGTWLKADDSTVAMLKRGVDTTFKRMPRQWELTQEELLGPHFQPEDEQIQILVELPRPPQEDDPRIVAITRAIFRHTILGVHVPPSNAERTAFKAALCSAYECNASGGTVRCMLLDTPLPSHLVVASHLFRRRLAFLADMMAGIKDIDDVHNGLLLFDPLKQAFDKFQISFIYEKTSDEFCLKVFDPSIKPTLLADKLTPKQRKFLRQGHIVPRNWHQRGSRLAVGTDFDLLTTFGDLNGRPLRFLTPTRPFRRCLNFQARLARLKAVQEAWIQPDEDDFEDFWEHGVKDEEEMASIYEGARKYFEK